MEPQRPLRIYACTTGDILLEKSIDDIKRSGGSGHSLTVLDALRIMRVDPVYSRLIRFTPQPDVNDALDDNAQLSWGSDYQLMQMRCPRCTLCGSPCERTETQHLLCTHDMKPTCVHLWHDIRRRSPRSEEGLRRHVSVQGYANGCGLDTELSGEEIRAEVNLIIQDELRRADLIKDELRRAVRRQEIEMSVAYWRAHASCPSVREALERTEETGHWEEVD